MNLTFSASCVSFKYEQTYQVSIGVRAGGARGRGGLQPPQILGNSDFLGSNRKFGQSHFLKTFLCFFLLV